MLEELKTALLQMFKVKETKTVTQENPLLLFVGKNLVFVFCSFPLSLILQFSSVFVPGLQILKTVI